MNALIVNPDSIQFISAEFREDSSFIIDVIRQCPVDCGLASFFKYTSSAIRGDREVVLEAVKRDGRALQYASSEFCSDREVVLEAVRNNGLALQYASSDICSDREVVLEAAKNDGHAIFYACADVCFDREVVLEAVKSDGCALQYASTELQSDREVVLEAVINDGYAICYACSDVCSDREVVLEAVKSNGLALKHAPADFCTDREVVMEAVKSKGYALEYASDELKNDRQVVIEAVKNQGYALQYASQHIIDYDKEVLFEAVAGEKTDLLGIMYCTFLGSVMGDKVFHEWVAKFYECHGLTVECYRSSFLCGVIQSHAPSSDGCNLSVLTKLGKYGLLEVKKLIGQYAGLQYGEFWQKILKVIAQCPFVVDWILLNTDCTVNLEGLTKLKV